MQFKEYFQLCEARVKPQPEFGTREYMQRALDRYAAKTEPTGFVLKVVYPTGKADYDDEAAVGQTVVGVEPYEEKMQVYQNLSVAIQWLNWVIQDHDKAEPLSASIWEYGSGKRRIVVLWEKNQLKWNKDYEQYAPHVHLKHSKVQAAQSSLRDLVRYAKKEKEEKGYFDDGYTAAQSRFWADPNNVPTRNIRKGPPKTSVT